MPAPEHLTFTAFKNHLARLIRLDPNRLSMDTNLVVDLGLDSLKLLEIILEFEKMGARVSLADAWGIQTLGDAYEYYRRSVAAGGKDQE